MQRKPANRLGLRGATEVKEHAWLKYYPWKDLYDKKIEAPFIPKVGDNFDAKYCNAPEKIGNDTKEKYDAYLRDENTKGIFRHFSYHNEENEDIPNKNSRISNSSVYTKDIKFVNPHANISNYHYPENKDYGRLPDKPSSREGPNSLAGISGIINSPSMDQSLDRNKFSLDKNPSNNIENKFLKLKKQSNSSSTASLLRQYRQSNISQNSTSGSINYINRRSGSSTNLNY